ncbi:hypothetical protein BD413DRAFT_555954 [Trametes elegans]|nr:hypothetical protein BD413DRAFT_555954 [Trametes elegans]
MPVFLRRFSSGLRLSSRRLRIFLYLLITCLFLCAVFSGAFLVAGAVSSNLSSIIDTASEGKSGLALLGHAYDVDIQARQVQMSWLIMGCGSYATGVGNTYHSKNCGRLNRPVDLYFDGSSVANGTYDPDTSILTSVESNDNFYVQATVEVQTEHLLEVTAWYGQDQQYAYPFDTYVLDTFFQAIDPGTNETLPTLFVRIADATNNLQPYFMREANVRTAKPLMGESTSAYGLRYTFRRTVLSQLFVMVLFIVNWLLTIVVVWIAVSAYDGLPVAEGVLILPVSVILTIPALRALWDGAPAFGLLLDSCGTFLQMVIVSLASIYLVVNIGLRRPKAAATAVALPPNADSAIDIEKDSAGVPLLQDDR